nr:hypothetical protein [Tanacetum cinerariifolium]
MLASTIVYQDPDEPIQIPYEIHKKLYNLTNNEIQEYLNKEEVIKKKAEQARLLAMTKSEIIKVVHEEDEKSRIDLKIILSAKGALPLPPLEQASSQLSGRKRTRLELEPEIRIHALECNMSIPKGVLFVNNIVIEEPEYEIFFIDVFGDECFQRWSDINKVGVKTLISYIVTASNISTPKNIYMLVEKKYLLPPPTLSMMLEKKLIVEYESKMAYQLLRFIIKQLKK